MKQYLDAQNILNRRAGMKTKDVSVLMDEQQEVTMQPADVIFAKAERWFSRGAK